jgi:hypothetical protein
MKKKWMKSKKKRSRTQASQPAGNFQNEDPDNPRHLTGIVFMRERLSSLL